jgi:arginase family protein
MLAALPAEVRMSPSSTNSTPGSTVTFGYRRANSSHSAQCVVARRPSSSPASARANAPVHSEMMRLPRAWAWRRMSGRRAHDRDMAHRPPGVNPLIIEVPSRLGLRPDGVQGAPRALRTAGLHARLGSADPARVDVPPYCDVRDPETGVLNPQGIAEVAQNLAAAVEKALDSGRFPIVLGGDCDLIATVLPGR